MCWSRICLKTFMVCERSQIGCSNLSTLQGLPCSWISGTIMLMAQVLGAWPALVMALNKSVSHVTALSHQAFQLPNVCRKIIGTWCFIVLHTLCYLSNFLMCNAGYWWQWHCHEGLVSVRIWHCIFSSKCCFQWARILLLSCRHWPSLAFTHM